MKVLATVKVFLSLLEEVFSNTHEGEEAKKALFACR